MNPEDRLPLFVFGTLRRGEENHHFLAGRFTRALSATLFDFRRITAAHGFPSIVRGPGESVAGEVYFLNPETYEETLRGCDRLEDLEPGQLFGAYYRRMTAQVTTVEGTVTAWVYADASLDP
jgi:gamma-glutamylcyclotransferase (GGCT)/AIG2-like uncharacterized protein YtfP